MSIKCVGVACVRDDNHASAVKLLGMIMEYNITNWNQGVWFEASGKIEKMCKELGGFNVPSKYAAVYLRDIPHSIIDDYHYSRKIGGNDEIKTIYGFKSQETFDILTKRTQHSYQKLLGQT